jgi:hypothetical protein
MTIAFALICSGIAAVSDRKRTETCPIAPPTTASGTGPYPAGHLLPGEAAAPGEIPQYPNANA